MKLPVPHLAIFSEYDIPDVHARAGALQAGIPNSKRDVIAKAAHLLPIEQPDLFNKAVSDSLSGLSR